MAIAPKLMQTMFIALIFISSYGQARNLIKNGTMTMEQRYRIWMSEQGRNSLDGAGEDGRFQIFKKNAEYVDKINSQSKPFKLALNKFADMTDEDLKASLGRIPYNASKRSARSPLMKTIEYDEANELPANIDWRKAGAVTPVKEQGSNCGSCWAFASVAALEGLIKIKQGLLQEFSEQNLVDCVGDKPFNNGCEGGDSGTAFRYIIDNGITSEREYPYIGLNKGGVCRKNETFHTKTTIHGYECYSTDEKELMKVAARQPVVTGVDPSCPAFTFYSSGILTEHCGNKIEHEITVVGYGEENGIKYWLAKNSWGAQWGEDGYIRIRRESGIKGGLCGLTLFVAYPILD